MKFDPKYLLMESNAIENVYDSTSFYDALCAWGWLRRHRRMTIPVILGAHSILMCNQDIPVKYRGQFRDCPVWVGGRECRKYYKIQDEIQFFVDLLNDPKSTDFIGIHVMFEHIHPFIDGNGRMGRMLLAWHELKHNKDPTVFTAAEKQDKYYPLFN